MPTRSLSIAIALAIGLAMPAAHAADAPNAGHFTLDLRLRAESVDDDAFARNADALTLRGRAGFRTTVKSGWSAFFEVEGNTHLTGDDFNSTDNGQVGYPTIADPDNVELNQAYLNYASTNVTRITFGRQRLIYDNQRFFGNVGWRQNEQTFDALDGQHLFGNGLTVRYSYLDRVQRVFGNENSNNNLARWKLNANLLSISHAVGPGTLTGYGYFIENQTLPLTSHRNLGLRYVAKHDAPDGIGWLASAEYAKQDNNADGNANIDAD